MKLLPDRTFGNPSRSGSGQYLGSWRLCCTRLVTGWLHREAFTYSTAWLLCTTQQTTMSLIRATAYLHFYKRTYVKQDDINDQNPCCIGSGRPLKTMRSTTTTCSPWRDQERERIAYAIPVNSIKNVENMQRMNAFFSDSMGMRYRAPREDITYTSNWPGDDLVGNHQPASTFSGQCSA